ncbi:Protein transport protein S9 plasma membrane t-SNARE [Entophlyctis luteolus]|nr:Protein transport protein S9 plasma membrane t-SNARE [Entophlyctis luteolus]
MRVPTASFASASSGASDPDKETRKKLRLLKKEAVSGPKRPLRPHTLYFKENYAAEAASAPYAKLSGIAKSAAVMKAIMQRYKALPAAEKEAYEKRCAEMKKAYEQEYAAFISARTPGQLIVQEKVRNLQKRLNPEKPTSKVAKDPLAPKKPETSFFLFLKKNRGTANVSTLAKQWRALPAAEKLPFMAEYLKAKEAFLVAKDNYEKSTGIAGIRKAINKELTKAMKLPTVRVNFNAKRTSAKKKPTARVGAKKTPVKRRTAKTTVRKRAGKTVKNSKSARNGQIFRNVGKMGPAGTTVTSPAQYNVNDPDSLAAATRTVQLESLDTAREALAKLSHADELGTASMASLAGQSEQLRRIEHKLDQADAHAQIAGAKVGQLKAVNRFFMVPASGAINRATRKEDEARQTLQTNSNRFASSTTGSSTNITTAYAPSAASAGASGGFYTTPSGLERDAVEEEIDSTLDQMSSGLMRMQQMAGAMTNELQSQKDMIGRINDKVGVVDGRVQKANNDLRRFK